MMPAVWILSLFVGWSSMPLRAAIPFADRNIVTEPVKKLLPGGPGQKPFDVTRHIIPIKEIESSVARDAIPALDDPGFSSSGEVGRLLKASDRVLGVALNGEAKAYPVRILNWHELVNDSVGGRPVFVSW
jgi:hypothetical protein